MAQSHAIFIVVPTDAVAHIMSSTYYKPSSLTLDGFIHACQYYQVAEVVERFYADIDNLSLLVVDPTLVEAQIHDEAPSCTMNSVLLFPHIYGALNIDAVVDVCALAHFKHQAVDSNTMALLRHYRFERLPVESTLYKSTWRSAQNNMQGMPVGTAMIGMYCETLTSLSCFHKLNFDEVWHFYAGDPLQLTLLYPDGESDVVILGNNFANGEVCQYRIPAGVWQGGCLVEGGQYALFGCTMAPGFTGDCFTAGVADELIRRYPQQREMILKLSVNGHETKMPEGFAS